MSETAVSQTLCGCLGCTKSADAVVDHPDHGERTVCDGHAGDHEVIRRV
jgi:hypothetical protein